MTDSPSLQYEERLWSSGFRLLAGVDEAGRGCLAGPVVAAAVIFPPHVRVDGVRDSKTLSPGKRSELAAEVRKVALSIGIGICTPAEIDELNVLHASMEAMRRAVESLTPAPDYVLIDGNRCFKDAPCPAEPIVKGDRYCHAIAAASIIAKTTRDGIMHALHYDYPVYHWQSNVGYPTRAHYEALAEYGQSPHHRQSFRLFDPDPAESELDLFA